MSKNENDRDDFWDIDKLIPQRKRKVEPFATQIKVADYSVNGQADSDKADRTLFFGGMSFGECESTTYTPQKNSLIKRVTIRRFVDKYDFYGSFRKAALLYYEYKTPPCEFTPYYSYLPQYNQLTATQKNYYFYWRDMLRRGKYIKCDYSYLYLFVYEILNLPDKIPPEKGVKLLSEIWRQYRVELPRIDGYFTLWMQDYCLVYGLTCPTAELSDFIFDIISSAEFKEFYLAEATSADGVGTEAMLAYLSDYDFRSSRYAEGEFADVFKRHMLIAMKQVIMHYQPESLFDPAKTLTIKRDAFAHSLCTHAVKCKLEIEYTSLLCNNELRRAITGAVRYTENKLRSLIGVKSRLGIKEILEPAKTVIDRYFEGIFEAEKLRRERENKPEYEKLYEAPSLGISFADADEIERASWRTTERLVSYDSDAVLDESARMSEVPSLTDEYGTATIEKSTLINVSGRIALEDETRPSSVFDSGVAAQSTMNELPLGLSKEDFSAICSLISGEKAVVTPDAYERINEAFLSSELCDIILTEGDSGYELIEDYREDVINILNVQN